MFYSNSTLAIEVTNFKFGLVCPNAESDVGWVCHQVKNIPITGQGQCVFDGKRVPCTWYGFSFNYTDAHASDVFQCTHTTSQPTTYGNPSGVLSKGTSGKYEFTVSEGEGKFFNPQYAVFAVERKGKEIESEHTECSVNGKSAFSFDVNYIFPVE
jgi:hypothetical protein